MGLSIRAYARHRGVSHVAVKKAIDTGRITPETDGTIEPNRADLEWAQNTVSARKPASAKISFAGSGAGSPVKHSGRTCYTDAIRWQHLPVTGQDRQ